MVVLFYFFFAEIFFFPSLSLSHTLSLSFTLSLALRVCLQLVTASADGTARVYNTQTGACQAILIGHEGEISKVCFNPQGTKILTASSDKTAR